MHVAPIAATDTHDLRRRVLRDGEPDAVVSWSVDDQPGTVHLGVFDDDGRLIGVSTWCRTETGVQLRGMATDPEALGRGVGSLLVGAGLDRARGLGERRVWANARVTALGFYERQGFVATGPVFDTLDTGLPHRLVAIQLV